MKALNVEMPDIEPKATEHIAEMINIAQSLIDKGYAYEINGDVYFRVKKYAKYGQLGKKNVEDLEAGARVEISEQKENPLDFLPLSQTWIACSLKHHDFHSDEHCHWSEFLAAPFSEALFHG